MPEDITTTEPIVEEIKKKLDAIGATSKENFETMSRNYEELKSVVERQGDIDPVTKEHLDKLTADVSTRQAEIDKQVAVANERMDQVEVAMKRTHPSHGTSIEEDRQLIKEAMAFQVQCMAAKEKTVNWQARRLLEADPEALKAYKTAFDEFLYQDEKALSPEAYKALQVGIDTSGGYTVTPQMSATILSRMFESDPIRQLATVLSITTGAIEFLADVDEADASWEGETQANDPSDTPNWDMKRIPVHVLAARPRASQTVLDDSGINLENWLSNKVAEKMGRTEGAAFVTGNGVGKPVGFGTYGDWDTAGTYQYGAVERVNMGHASLFTTDGLLNVKYQMIEQYLNRGTWLTNRLNVRDIMKLKDGDGQYIWRPGIELNQPSILLGLPIRMSTTVAVTASSALAIYLADWKRAYTIVDRQGISVQRDPYTAKPMVEYYTRKRVGGDVTDFQAIKIGVVSA
jgi:HK97 family phage major capsid protein